MKYRSVHNADCSLRIKEASLITILLVILVATEALAADVIVYSRQDGGVSVVSPSPRYMAELIASGLSEEQALKVVMQKDVPADALGATILDAATLPTEAFRHAWRLSGARVSVDVDAARQIHRSKLERIAARDANTLLSAERDALLFRVKSLNLAECLSVAELMMAAKCWLPGLPRD